MLLLLIHGILLKNTRLRMPPFRNRLLENLSNPNRPHEATATACSVSIEVVCVLGRLEVCVCNQIQFWTYGLGGSEQSLPDL